MYLEGKAIQLENIRYMLASGVAAGIFTLAVNTGPLPESALTDEGANLLFKNMTELAESFNTLKTEWEA